MGLIYIILRGTSKISDIKIELRFLKLKSSLDKIAFDFTILIIFLLTLLLFLGSPPPYDDSPPYPYDDSPPYPYADSPPYPYDESLSYPYYYSPSEIVKDEIEKLVSGYVLFNPSQEMTVGEKERIEVRIAKNFTQIFSKELKGLGKPQIENISVGTLMCVRLKGNDFYIESLSPENQPISDKMMTQWDFDVIPLKSGNKSLRLSVTARIKIPNEPEEKMDIYVLEKQINVKVNPIEDELKNLTLDQIYFNASQEMTVDVMEKVEVHIPRNIIENLSKGLGEIDVNLTGKNFDIEKQERVSVKGFTKWVYYVTPLQSGNQSLVIIVSVKLKFPNGEREKYERVLERTINVKVNIRDLIHKFIEDNWQWIASTIIGSGLIGWIIKKRIKSRKKKYSQKRKIDTESSKGYEK